MFARKYERRLWSRRLLLYSVNPWSISTVVEDTMSDKPKLAMEGGIPVRTKPLPLEFPGVHN